MVEDRGGHEGREQDRPETLLVPPLFEFRPGVMTLDGHLIEIIHAGAAEVQVRHRKAGRLDNMGLDIQAGAEPQNRPRVLRDVGAGTGQYAFRQTQSAPMNFTAPEGANSIAVKRLGISDLRSINRLVLALRTMTAIEKLPRFC